MNRRVVTQPTKDDVRIEDAKERLRAYDLQIKQLSNISTQISDRESELTLIEETLETKRHILNEVSDDLTSKEEKLVAVLSEIKMSNKRKETLFTEITELEKTRHDLEKDILIKQKKLGATEAALSAVVNTSKEDEQLNLLNIKIQELSRSVSEKEKTVQLASQSLSDIQSNTNKEINRFEKLQVEVNEMVKQKEAETKELASIRKDVAKYIAAIEQAKKDADGIIKSAETKANTILSHAQSQVDQINLDRKIVDEARKSLLTVKQVLEKEGGRVIKVKI